MHVKSHVRSHSAGAIQFRIECPLKKEHLRPLGPSPNPLLRGHWFVVTWALQLSTTSAHHLHGSGASARQRRVRTGTSQKSPGHFWSFEWWEGWKVKSRSPKTECQDGQGMLERSKSSKIRHWGGNSQSPTTSATFAAHVFKPNYKGPPRSWWWVRDRTGFLTQVAWFISWTTCGRSLGSHRFLNCRNFWLSISGSQRENALRAWTTT